MSLKLTDCVAEKVYIIALVSSLFLFIFIYELTGNSFYLVLSILMTLKLARGNDLYLEWQEEYGGHQWMHLLLCLFFYLIKAKK